MKKYKIKRYDVKGYCYGETVYTGQSKKACLEHLRHIFKINKHNKIEREGNTFTKYTDTNIFHYAVLPMGGV